jgi:tetratricopeptide (TPR) repeat protein
MKHDEIVAEIGRLSEATADLKKQMAQPKSRLDRFKEYAGVISLVLSLATGFFAVYTTLVTEPQKSRADDQAKLHEALAQIVSLDQEYLKELQQGDPNANNGTLESKRNIVLQQAEDLADRRSVASFEDQINLGNSYQFGRRYDPAMNHFKAALNLAGSDHLKKATADTRIAQLDFYGISGGTKDDARRLFDDAEKELAPLKSSEMEMALAQSLSVRSQIECSVGEPELGLKAKAKASALVDTVARDPVISPVLVDSLRVGLVTGLSNTRCAQSVSPTPPSSSALPVSGNKVDLSNQILQLLIQRQYATLESRMNATVSSQVPLDRVQAIWDGLAPQIGSYKRTTGTETTSFNNIPVYVVHGEFEKAFVDLRLAFDGTNQLSYFLVTPRSALPKQDIEHRATAVASDFFGQKFHDVSAKFDGNLAMQLPEARLTDIWTQATNATGSFVRTTAAAKNNDFDFVDVMCEMQAGKLVVRVGYDLDMKINTFVVAPGK